MTMTLELQAQVVFNLLLAAFCGMIIGFDRERRRRPAGLRTHMLVCLGACLFTILSLHAFPGSDSGRVAAQVVVGIGFLGAGVIVLRGGEPRDVTTAADIWATAAVGMTTGTGAWLLALAATLLIWFILAVLRKVEDKPPL